MGTCCTKLRIALFSSSSSPGKKTKENVTILEKLTHDITSDYEFDRELGRGKFGVTRLCIEKATRLEYACKSISKAKLVEKDIEDVKREIKILQHLTGQPSIVGFKGAYEDEKDLHLVMELCLGGDLYDWIFAKKSYSEGAAAFLGRQIVTVVNICHFMGVMHRDLKPENFLFANQDTLKAIDFGHSVFIKEGKNYPDFVGSVYYVAPEALAGKYGKEIDVWSAGVILYILLSGVPPFSAEKEEDISKAILEGKLNLQSEPWPSISDSAKDLIKKMLTHDPQERITAAEALEHPWLKEGGEVSDNPVHVTVLVRMKEFRAMNNLKKFAIRVIAESLSETEIKGLKELFDEFDEDKSGLITYDELKNGLARLGFKHSEAEVKQLLDAADVDKNGTIDHKEFITAIMSRHKPEEEGNNKGFIPRNIWKDAMTKHRMGKKQA